MFRGLKKYFTITNREFNGMIVLLLIITSVFLFPYILDKISYKQIDISVQELQPIVNKLESNSKTFLKENNQQTFKHKSSKILPMKKFDPNNLTIDDWMSMGLSEKQAKPIINYIAKGGRFYQAEDLRKMYTINTYTYSKIAPYVEISSKNKTSTESNLVKPTILKIIELNTADSASLTTLNGVGPTFASRIIKYRKKLGGFHSSNQLLEVYGFDSLKYIQIKNNVTVLADYIYVTSINTDNFNELKKIPYLSYKQINVIFNYRKQHGNYDSIADLENVKILNKEIIEKIKPYVKF